MVVAILQGYFILVTILMLIYMLRHLVFTFNRLYARQRVSYRDIYDSDLPTVTILIPMYNEEKVLLRLIDALLACDYDQDKIEIIAIDDNSSDATTWLLDAAYSEQPWIRPLHRPESAERGKPAGLNDGLAQAKGDIVIVFDADYVPSQNLIKKLAGAFCDPQVGAVMGRVIPVNPGTNTLTNLLNLERSGGYQIDQQARFNLGLLPQYGGTVGGFRRDVVLKSGGFDTRIVAEDTELTYRLYTMGYKVIYDNSAECYEEVPEEWSTRGRQVRRWSRGHNGVMFRYFGRILTSRQMGAWERLDGMLLLLVYLMPVLLGLAIIDCVALFFLGAMDILGSWWALFFVSAYNAWGNFAPFYEVSAGALLDGMDEEILYLPLLGFSYFFYMVFISLGFLDAILDAITNRRVEWAKTQRYAQEEPVQDGSEAGP